MLEDAVYTRKIEIPTYTPSNKKPNLSGLYSVEKRDELLIRIEKSEVPEELKIFLRSSAERHTKFNFAKIADFYAHSNSDIKELFEDSALVIIDHEDAIKNGFVAFQESVDKDIQLIQNDQW